ncbi:hypothetical protein GCM10027592_45780 [Spirosoma flavus]
MNQITDHFLFDAAKMGEAIKEAKKIEENHSSLYKGQSEKTLDIFAPYIFTINPKMALANWYFSNGWGKAWGIILKSQANPREIYNHFRRFLLVKAEDGRELYFRFYDPRVLRVFLPTCDTSQLQEFFGPVQSFFMEDEDPAYSLEFWLEEGQLKRARKELLKSEPISK